MSDDKFLGLDFSRDIGHRLGYVSESHSNKAKATKMQKMRFTNLWSCIDRDDPLVQGVTKVFADFSFLENVMRAVDLTEDASINVDAKSC